MKKRLISAIVVLACLLVLANCNKQDNSSASNAPNSEENSARQSSSGSESAARSNKSRSETRQPERAEAEQAFVVPAGTPVTVRLAQAVGSKISESGSTFDASVERPVAVQGKTVIPEGAEASGTVTEANPAGRFKGGASLRLTLNTIKINGRTYDVQTSNISEVSKGKGKRSAVLIGGGAGLGALIGGLAGGGKGAAIGALAGGGAGTAGAGLTGKNDITLPAEAAVTFKLEQPLEFK